LLSIVFYHAIIPDFSIDHTPAFRQIVIVLMWLFASGAGGGDGFIFVYTSGLYLVHIESAILSIPQPSEALFRGK